MTFQVICTGLPLNTHKTNITCSSFVHICIFTCLSGEVWKHNHFKVERFDYIENLKNYVHVICIYAEMLQS